MTKRELLDLLAPFSDDQYVVVIETYKEPKPWPLNSGNQLIIQGVRGQPPWRGRLQDLSNDMIAIVIGERNAELTKEQCFTTPPFVSEGCPECEAPCPVHPTKEGREGSYSFLPPCVARMLTARLEAEKAGKAPSIFASSVDLR